MYCFILLSDHIPLTVNTLLYTDGIIKQVLCVLQHRTCSRLWSKGRLAPPMRTACSCSTSSCPTSTQLCRLCFATCRSVAAASTPTSMTTARSASVCWAPGSARWALFYRFMCVQVCLSYWLGGQRYNNNLQFDSSGCWHLIKMWRSGVSNLPKPI